MRHRSTLEMFKLTRELDQYAAGGVARQACWGTKHERRVWLPRWIRLGSERGKAQPESVCKHIDSLAL
jgi:hypothetical protein